MDLGLPIIPVCSHDHVGYSERHKATCNQAGKVPVIKGWQSHATTSIEQARTWIKEFKNINIGLPLGHVSGYVGIDVDGSLGEILLDEMSDGDLPETWEYVTGAGRRLLYSIPVGMQTKKFNNKADGDHEECAILAFGQQTILPPSVHHTGRIYEWVEGRSPEDLDCALAPHWLIELVRVESVNKGSGHLGRMDLTKPGAPQVPVAKVDPILVSDTVLPSEFSEFESLEINLIAPDDSYTGTKTKEQAREEVPGLKPEELTQRISAGGRDNQMTKIIGSFCAKNRHLGKDYVMFMAQNHNTMFCDPPLDEMSIAAKVNHFWETEQMKSAQFKNGSIDGGEKKVFEPGTIAQVVLNEMEDQGYVIKVDPKEPIIWVTKKSEGPWRPYNAGGNAEDFQVFMRRPVADPKLGGDARWMTRKSFGEVANALVLELRDSRRFWTLAGSDMDTQTVDAYKYIPLAGGKLLEWKSGELKAWDPDTNLTYVLPVEYDPDATAPAWEKRLLEWLPDEGSRAIMQEFVGYSFIPYMGFEKALMIQGEGANGKSLFLETIQGLLGYKVVESINMRNLFSRFGSSELLGKILNIVNEAGAEYLRGGAADEFKNLVSGGRIKADIKNKAPLTFNNTAKFIFAANHDIKTGDKSEGWLRRMLIVPFDQDFTKSETPKYEIMQELRGEYAGIFNWALEGLQRLMQNKAFSVSETATIKMADYRQKNDIAADFYANCLRKFELELQESGKAKATGLPSGLVNSMFESWILYRESTVTKFKERMKEYLTAKHNLKIERTKNTLILNKTMTLCWIGLDLDVRDVGFLEHLRDDPIPRYPEVKDYAIKRLDQIDASTGHATEAVVTDFPSTVVIGR